MKYDQEIDLRHGVELLRLGVLLCAMRREQFLRAVEAKRVDRGGFKSIAAKFCSNYSRAIRLAHDAEIFLSTLSPKRRAHVTTAALTCDRSFEKAARTWLAKGGAR